MPREKSSKRADLPPSNPSVTPRASHAVLQSYAFGQAINHSFGADRCGAA